MAQVVQEVIDYYERLVHEHPSPESWAVNIQKAIRQLPTEIAMSNFYSYLFNPTSYIYRDYIPCLTQNDVDTFERNAKAFDEQIGMKVTTYTNLYDGKILYDSMNKLRIDNGKPVDEIFVGISEEKQRSEPQRGNEESICTIQEEEEKINDNIK